MAIRKASAAWILLSATTEEVHESQQSVQPARARLTQVTLPARL